MADVVSSIVPSSVPLERAAWHGQQRQRKREKESRGENLAADEPPAAQAGGGAAAAPEDQKTDKGKHLDISV